jgi:alkanesulfonate monooxygenase SsuD/methylene tetrahydromethanopterin reductase-like flavin-dependent oxidoreductase (luciferase family)
VRIGVTLPQFRDEADSAVDAARRAEALGLDGVFCFDHLWPMGQPGRPALASGPLLGALVASTATIAIGTLVARIGLLPDEVLVTELISLASLGDGRLIAGVGTGDRLSRAENDAYGIPFEPAGERRARVATVAAALRDQGIPVWIGGGRAETVDLARTLGVAVNLWEGERSSMAELVAAGVDVTWGGPVGEGVEAATATLLDVAGTGSSWAVCAWPDSLEVVAEAAEAVRSRG